MLRLIASCLLGAATVLASAEGLQPVAGSGGSEPSKPWREVAFPKGKIPATQFDVHSLAGERVLRIRADKSYGALSHAWSGPAGTLSWRWQLEQGLTQADLRTKQGDDSALKVCVMFDMPLSGLPLGERNKMRFARLFSGEPLPAATLCYVWDANLPVGTQLPNAYTPRLRYWVVTSGPAKPGQWQSISRDVAQDFKQAFGHESPEVPPVLAVVLGADADNTQGSSVGYVADVQLKP
jgi:Protein of unknown function (DUF3047)